MLSVKTATYVCNSFKMKKKNFFLKFKWKVLKQINSNLGGLSRGSFLPPYSNEITSLKNIPSFEFAYISCMLYIWLLWLCIVGFEQVNVSRVAIYNNSNSMWCLVTFNKIFFVSLQKGGDTACVNYLKVKNDKIHWKTIISDKSQIHPTPNFSLLSS